MRESEIVRESYGESDREKIKSAKRRKKEASEREKGIGRKKERERD